MACAPPTRYTSIDAQNRADAQNFLARARARDADAGNAGDLGGNHGHQQGRRQRIAAGGDVGPHRIERADDLAEPAAVGILDLRVARQLHLCEVANVLRRDLDGRPRNPASGDRERPRSPTDFTRRLPAKLSNLRAYSSTAASPRARMRSRIGATIASASARRASLRVIRRWAAVWSRIRIIFTLRSC